MVGMHAVEVLDPPRPCAESRRIVAEADPTETLAADPERPYSLRRILVHMIEETARHNGHADIMRELTDGQTGE